MTKPSRLLMSGAVVAALVGSALAATSTPSAGGTAPDRFAAKSTRYAQPSAGAWKWEQHFSGVSGGFTIKAGKNGKPPKVTKIHYTTLEDDGYYCPPVGTTVKVKGSFPLRKASKYSSNPGPVFSPWTLSKKDAKADQDDVYFHGIKTVKATVTVGGNSFPGEIAMFFERELPDERGGAGLKYAGFGVVKWESDDPNIDSSCYYDADSKPAK